MKNMGGPAASGIDSSQMKEQMKRIGEMSPDELKTPLGLHEIYPTLKRNGKR